jgi:hypothetical protein
MRDSRDDALRRVAASVGGSAIDGMDLVERLAGLSGSDFTTLMLEVARRRAARETPASVLRRYRDDRFCKPGSTSRQSLLRAETLLVDCLPDQTELMTLAPVVPLGTHSVLGTVNQDQVVTALRPCEVAADPTNALALEAAARRSEAGRGRSATGDGIVRLAGMQRVLRAQRFPAPFQAHFSVFGLVTAGRDEGDRAFERRSLAGHLRFALAGLRAAGAREVEVALTPLSPAGELIADAVRSLPASVVFDTGRQGGRGYYLDLCFKVNSGGLEVGDGGFTDWTCKLTGNAKERLLTSGLGLERVAAVLSAGRSAIG